MFATAAARAGWVPAYRREETVDEGLVSGTGSISTVTAGEPPARRHPIGFAPAIERAYDRHCDGCADLGRPCSDHDALFPSAAT